MRSVCPLLALSLTACAALPTRYRVGDFVVYSYQGAALAEPVKLREEIVAQQGNHLRIDVTATRASGTTRTWAQVVTDTPSNQRKNVIDALYEKTAAGWVKLANKKNREVYRLYEWTLFTPDKPQRDVEQQPCKEEIAGQRFACTCTYGLTTFRGQSVRIKESECADFVWTHGPSDVWPMAGEPPYTADVIEAGRTGNAVWQPLLPIADAGN
jgi:hypothetical protein